MLLLLSCAGAGILLMVFILHSRGLKRLSCEDHVQPMASLYGTVDTVSPSHFTHQCRKTTSSFCWMENGSEAPLEISYRENVWFGPAGFLKL